MDRKCAKCEKTYSTEGNLRKHIRTKHPNDQSIIPRKYKEEGYTVRGMWTEHGVKILTKSAIRTFEHKTSLALDVSLLITSDEGWTFKSSSSKVYFINEVDTDCNCQLRCNYCDACIHRYSCTCMDSAIKWIMCKHIHLVCMFRAQTTKQQSLLINDNDDLAGELVQNNELQMDVNPITGTALTQQKQSQEQIETKQSQKMKNSFLTILEKTNTLAELDILKKKAAPIGPTVAAVKSLTTSPQIERSQVKSRSPLNKHVSQRKHLSTKKERLANAEKLTKPSASEIVTIVRCSKSVSISWRSVKSSSVVRTDRSPTNKNTFVSTDASMGCMGHRLKA
ncbi:hypothetical protein YQE_11415, partial [Dendroctonus ponderosae]